MTRDSRLRGTRRTSPRTRSRSTHGTRPARGRTAGWTAATAANRTPPPCARNGAVLARGRVGLPHADRFVVREAKLRILLGSIERPGSVRFVVFHSIEPTRCPRRHPLPSVSMVHHSSETIALCPGSSAPRPEPRSLILPAQRWDDRQG